MQGTLEATEKLRPMRIRRSQKQINADDARGSKVCTGCGEDKVLSDYYPREGRGSGSTGFVSRCKVCFKTRESKEVVWERGIKHRFDITAEDYWGMYAEQGGVCAICRCSSSKKLVVDHCHDKGHVRGLLCGDCNCGLGLFKDNQENLIYAGVYLNKERFDDPMDAGDKE